MPLLPLRRTFRAFAAIALVGSLASSASASPEMAIERAAWQAAESRANGEEAVTVYVPLADATQAMLRPGCRVALDLPRPADPSMATAEDERELEDCVAAMQHALHWPAEPFAACNLDGIAFVLAKACESATTLFLSHHVATDPAKEDGGVSQQLLRESCQPSSLCP